jgi:molybdopterin-guanine dinucleotide biosynthesis protein A
VPDRYPHLAGFVLAGGASRRMGRPKQDLTLGDGTLLTRAVRLLRSVTRTVAVLGPRECAPAASLSGTGTQELRSADSRFKITDSGVEITDLGLDVPVFPDLIPGRGPLAGILTGLCHTRSEFNLFLSCDSPFMSIRFLRYLSRRALESQADVTLAKTPREGLQPLAAIYRRRARTAIRASLQAGHNKVTSFFPRVDVRILPWPELARAGFPLFIFDNLNTREDYGRALRRIGNASPGQTPERRT